MSKNQNPVTKKSGASINIILTVIVVIVAVVVIGGVLYFKNSGNSNTTGSGASQPTVAADVLRKSDSHLLTEASNGKVTVTEFLDYQCPGCHAYYQGLTKQIEQDYAGRITFVTRNYPLQMHPLAQPAARAAEAAGLQGKYKEMYHALYDNYQSWAIAADGKNVSDDQAKATAQFDNYAQQIGLDLTKFHQDIASPAVQSKIDADIADGNKAGVQGTPTIFINGKQFDTNGVQTYQQLAQKFRQELDAELNK